MFALLFGNVLTPDKAAAYCTFCNSREQSCRQPRCLRKLESMVSVQYFMQRALGFLSSQILTFDVTVKADVEARRFRTWMVLSSAMILFNNYVLGVVKFRT